MAPYATAFRIRLLLPRQPPLRPNGYRLGRLRPTHRPPASSGRAGPDAVLVVGEGRAQTFRGDGAAGAERPRLLGRARVAHDDGEERLQLGGRGRSEPVRSRPNLHDRREAFTMGEASGLSGSAQVFFELSADFMILARAHGWEGGHLESDAEQLSEQYVEAHRNRTRW